MRVLVACEFSGIVRDAFAARGHEAWSCDYAKLAPAKTEFECLSEKINANADTTSRMVDALRDGQINEVEAEKILDAIEKERNVLDIIETMMQFKVVPEVRKQVRRFVKSTGNR